MTDQEATPFSERAIALAVEDWLHKVMDAEYRPTPRATMRWQWCKRPHHPEDDDCAACLRTSEDALQEAEEGCGCICHKRTKSLAAFLHNALKPDYERLLEVERAAKELWAYYDAAQKLLDEMDWGKSALSGGAIGAYNDAAFALQKPAALRRLVEGG